MSRRVLARHPFQFANIEEYTTMRRYLAQSGVPRGARYNVDAAVYTPNLRSVAFAAFGAVGNPPPPPPCLEELLSGGDPSTSDYIVFEDGGFYNTDTPTTIITGGEPSTNFCGV
jgi:hypothetical protein